MGGFERRFNRLPDVKIVLTEEGEEADLRGAHVIESSPSPGAAGFIAINYLVESLKPVKLGEVKSPHFPQISLVNEQGIASPPRMEMYLHEDGGTKLLLILRNFPIESSEGSYVVARELYRFLKERGVASYYLLSGSRILGEPAVYVASTSMDRVKPLLDSGAKPTPNLDNLPVDRLSSYMLMFFSREGGAAYLLIAEVVSYFPDPLAAKKLLQVLSRALKFSVDMEKLDIEIEKQKRMLEEFQRGLGHLLPGKEEHPTKEPFYIG